MELRQGTRKARHLRISSTDAEALLWRRLRNRNLDGFKFRRQFPISGYIADFVCLECFLIVEVDGSQHADREQHDLHRTDVLRKSGFRTARFWNDEVLTNIEGVLTEILSQLAAPPSPGARCAPASPASGRGGKR